MSWTKRQIIEQAFEEIGLTNVTASAATFSLNLITTGTADDSNLIIKSLSVAAGQTYLCPEIVGHVIESGGSISAIAGTANALVFRVSGREVA